MRSETRPARSLPLLLLLLAAAPADAQVPQRTRVWLQGELGVFHHATDLHPYYPLRFRNAPEAGAALAYTPGAHLAARVSASLVQTRLRGPGVAPARYQVDGPDWIFNMDAALIGAVRLPGTPLRPYAGAGVGVQRLSVHDWLGGDDVAEKNWMPDVQQNRLREVLVGVDYPRGRLRLAGEIRLLRSSARVVNEEFARAFHYDVASRQDEVQVALRVAMPLPLPHWVREQPGQLGRP